jgi:hypothetical protein
MDGTNKGWRICFGAARAEVGIECSKRLSRETDAGW